MKPLIAFLIVTLAILHHDFWWWEDSTPVFGFLPIGLAWHAGISIAAGILWWLATRYAWPAGLEETGLEEQSSADEEAVR